MNLLKIYFCFKIYILQKYILSNNLALTPGLKPSDLRADFIILTYLTPGAIVRDFINSYCDCISNLKI